MILGARQIALIALLLLIQLPQFAHATESEVSEGESVTPTVVAEETIPTPDPSSTPDIDMSAFQEAYDREVASAQAEATGNPDIGSADAGAGDGTLQLALRSTAALAGICGAIIFLGWAARRFGSRTPLLAGTTLAQVLGRTYLEPKAALHFVKTGGRVLVVGVTPNAISLITEFDADQFESAPSVSELPRAAAPADFLSRLKEQHQAATQAPAPADEDLNALRGDIQRLKEFLQESRRGGL